MKKEFGNVIFLNGTSSSGKSTIAGELQKKLIEPFLHISVDSYLHQLPQEFLTDQKAFSAALPNLLAGFHASSVAVASAGNNVIIDHVLQEPEWVVPCVEVFDGDDLLVEGDWVVKG